jgi:predicted membrane channel-forming protein YqfA (hemolysin III family)
VIYTLGAPIHRLTRLRYHDAIWHGSVTLAAGCHFVVVVMWLVS